MTLCSRVGGICQDQLPEAKAFPGTPKGTRAAVGEGGPGATRLPGKPPPRSGGAVSRDVQADRRPLPWQNLPGTCRATQPGCAEPRPLTRISDVSPPPRHPSASREPLGLGSPLLSHEPAVASGKSRHCLNLQLPQQSPHHGEGRVNHRGAWTVPSSQAWASQVSTPPSELRGMPTEPSLPWGLSYHVDSPLGRFSHSVVSDS